MKTFLTAFISIQFGLFSYSQESYSTVLVSVSDDANSNSIEWQNYFSNNDFSIEYKYFGCDMTSGYDQELVLLKFTNYSTSAIALNWHLDLYYNDDCKTCNETQEYGRTLVLSPEEFLEGKCTYESDFRLKIFSKFIDPYYTKGDQLSAFKLNNLTMSFNE
jgi:hypothetical protein